MFYISARGSSASTWLNKMLSKHEKIVCFQSSRSFPPVWPGKTFPYVNTWVKEIEPQKYIESLILCEKSTHSEKIFGSVHGYHGIDAKPHCENYGGIFSYIARNPLERIHSQYIHSLEDIIYKNFNTLRNEEIHSRSCKVLENENLVLIAKEREKKTLEKKRVLKLGKKLVPDFFRKKLKNYLFLKRIKNKPKLIKQPDERVVMIDLAISYIKEYLSYDQILFNSCEKSAGLKMEEFVKSKKYFSDILKNRIDNNIFFSNDYLDEVFNGKRFWVHRKKPLTDKEIWESWPQSMRDLFIFYFSKYNLKGYMNHFNYRYEHFI